MNKNKHTLLGYLSVLLCACSVNELPIATTSQSLEQLVPEQDNPPVVTPIELTLDTVVAFSNTSVAIIDSIEVSGDGDFQLVVGSTIGTVEPGTMVAGAGVKLGGFHNSPIAYKVTTPDGLEGFITPENTGLRLRESRSDTNRYVQARDLIRLGHLGCPTDGPPSTVTIWSDGQSLEIACSEVFGLLPELNQGVVY